MQGGLLFLCWKAEDGIGGLPGIDFYKPLVSVQSSQIFVIDTRTLGVNSDASTEFQATGHLCITYSKLGIPEPPRWPSG